MASAQWASAMTNPGATTISDHPDTAVAEPTSNSSATSNTPELPSVRIRGIPFQESEYTVFKYFGEKGVTIRNGVLGVHFLYNEKRQWSGDAYIQLETEKDLQAALQLHETQMQHRYLEVFRSNDTEMDAAMKKSPFYRLPDDFAVRLRGLEYKVTADDIRTFFQGLEIAPGTDAIYIVENQEGRSTGEAYVRFKSKEAVEQAVAKHKEKMGHRYLEIFLASSAQIKDAQEFFPDERAPPAGRGVYSDYRGSSRDGGRGGDYYDRYPPRDDYYGCPRGGGLDYDREPAGGPRYEPWGESPFSLYMRGLPWVVKDSEIHKFFHPLRVVSILKNTTSSSVFDGSAWVEFSNQMDYDAAKKLHKSQLGHRYIELFTADEVEGKRIRHSRGRSGPPPPRGPPGRGSDRRGSGSSRRDGPSGRDSYERHRTPPYPLPPYRGDPGYPPPRDPYAGGYGGAPGYGGGDRNGHGPAPAAKYEPYGAQPAYGNGNQMGYGAQSAYQAGAPAYGAATATLTAYPAYGAQPAAGSVSGYQPAPVAAYPGYQQYPPQPLQQYASYPTATQPSYGQAATQPTYGQAATQPTYGQGTTTQSTYGQAATQSAYGQAATQSTYGQAATPSTYGQAATQSTYGQAATPSTYGQAATQPTYGQAPAQTYAQYPPR